jgi:hypothetical protein
LFIAEQNDEVLVFLNLGLEVAEAEVEMHIHEVAAEIYLVLVL